MSGTPLASNVVVFTADPRLDEKARHLHSAYYEAYQAMASIASRAGLPTHGESPLCQMFHAGHRYAAVWERRAKRLTRQLQAALSSDVLTDDTRAVIVKTLTGSTRYDAKLLTPDQGQHLEDLAALTVDDRRLIRQLVKALALRNAMDNGGAQ